MLTHEEWRAISLAVEREVVYGIRLMLYALKTGELSIEDLKFAILKKSDDFMMEMHDAAVRSFCIVAEPEGGSQRTGGQAVAKVDDLKTNSEAAELEHLLNFTALQETKPYLTRDNCHAAYSQQFLDTLNEVLAVISENPCIQRRQIVDKLGISVRSVRTALVKLKDEYKLIEMDEQCYHGWRLKKP